MGLRTLIPTALICFCAGGLYGWSALILPLEALFGVSTMQTGLVFSLAITSFTGGVLITPRLLGPKVSLSRVAGFGIAAAICVFAASQMVTFESFLLWFSAGFGGASGGIYISALGVASTSRAFQVATPVMVAAFGTGGAVFGPIWRVLHAYNWGLDGLILLGAGLALFSLMGLWLARGHPAPNQPNIPMPAPKGPLGMGLKQANIWLIFACGSFAGLMVLGLATKMMDVAGAGVALASITLAGIALGNTFGRLSIAILSKQMTLKSCLYLAIGLSLTGLSLAVAQIGLWALSAGLILVATGYGIVASTIPILTREAFGPDQFQPRFALIFSALGGRRTNRPMGRWCDI